MILANNNKQVIRRSPKAILTLLLASGNIDIAITTTIEYRIDRAPRSLGLSLFSNVPTLTFFNCYLAIPRPTLGHSPGDSLTNPMLITAFLQFRSEGHREPRNEAGFPRPAKQLVEFEPGTFRF